MDEVDQDAHEQFPTKKEQVLNDFRNFSNEHLCLYSKSRNFDLGHPHANVSKLSPYLRRRLVSENEVLQIALETNSISSLEKFIQEIFWRTYWRGWLELHPIIWNEYEKKIQDIEPPKKTGIKCFDYWTQELIELVIYTIMHVCGMQAYGSLH